MVTWWNQDVPTEKKEECKAACLVTSTSDRTNFIGDLIEEIVTKWCRSGVYSQTKQRQVLLLLKIKFLTQFHWYHKQWVQRIYQIEPARGEEKFFKEKYFSSIHARC